MKPWLGFLFGLLALRAGAYSVTVEWDASPPEIKNYGVYVGTASRSYTLERTTGSTVFTFPNLSPNQTYYFAVTAIDDFGLESDYSNEVSFRFQPEIFFSHAAADSTLEWSADFTGFKVQWTPDFLNWFDLGRAPVRIGPNWRVIDTQYADNRFYRLKFTP